MKVKKCKELYYCDHCNKMYQRKHAAIKHEKYCNKNPENKRACFNCQYLEMKVFDFYYDSYAGEEITKVEAFYCGKVDKAVYPPKVERSFKGPYEFGDLENVKMPKECKLQKQYLQLDVDSNLF